jgi:hypothetical protein
LVLIDVSKVRIGDENWVNEKLLSEIQKGKDHLFDLGEEGE